MKISRQSWHYKLVDSAFSSPSKSLCIYFWQIPIAVMAWMFMVLASLVIVSAVVFILAMPVIFNFWAVDYGIIIAMGLVSTFVWYEAVLKPFNNHFRNSPWNITLSKKSTTKEGLTAKKESLVFEYLKAKKDKVCPTIEFEWS